MKFPYKTKSRTNIKLTFNLAIPHLGENPEKIIQNDTFCPAFTAALFTGHGSNLNTQ